MEYLIYFISFNFLTVNSYLEEFISSAKECLTVVGEVSVSSCYNNIEVSSRSNCELECLNSFRITFLVLSTIVSTSTYDLSCVCTNA